MLEPARHDLRIVVAPDIRPEAPSGKDALASALDTDLTFEPMPPRMYEADWNRFMVWAADRNVSDIRLQPFAPAFVQRYGRLRPATTRDLTIPEVETATNLFYGADGMARLKQGMDFDVSYKARPERNRSIRFRVNATGCETHGVITVSIVARVLPERAPDLSSLALEPEILAAYRISKGVVIVSGATENGKSTLLAGMIRAMLLDPDAHLSILEYAAPIEFVYDDVRGASALISPAEIPRDMPSFAAGARNAKRRNPKVAVLGEIRDAETIVVMSQMAISGTAIYGTMHAGSVEETTQIAVSLCPVNERNAVAVQLGQSLRLIINQRLVPSVDGKRTALREFLVFDKALNHRLVGASPDDWPSICREALRTQGQSFTVAANRALAQGRISEETAFYFKKEFGDVA
ncbi:MULTISPECIES: type IV pilus twitching motility protein PilT [Acidiphilium]|uniref:Defect in organelle trafficking protein DotB n=1 Tax=Acidiphilium rubrum TaxID=526 RepID=A0A8G2CMQ1_ACIRU|nr:MULTISPECIES: ATPase, T2SS/T4P/T4SS family [Acidiphilium]SIR29085.1 defect in organelle trafficking protein DotB [Acidiphilium rubrum]